MVVMNTKRVLISVALGAVFGAICAYGTASNIPEGLPLMPILAATFYDRVLIGIVIGIADCIKAQPALRGAVLGAIVSVVIAIPSGTTGGAILIGAGIVYGVIIDLVATRTS